MIKPLRDIILVKEEKEEKTSSGIILPDTREEESQVGSVVAVGPDVSDIEEGDKIFFRKWAGSKVETPEKTVLFVEQEEVLAKYD